MARMSTRQALKDGPTKWFSFRLPEPLFEKIRMQAFEERKSIALVITEMLEAAVAGRGGGER
jgi:hypothetical protein